MLDVTEYQVDGGKGFREDVSWMYQLLLKSSHFTQIKVKKSVIVIWDVFKMCK